jgi:hypothetical protein
MLKNERTNVHDEEQSGWPYVVSGDLVQCVGQKNCIIWHITISELSCEFPQISRTVLYEIILVWPGCHKFCARWVLIMLASAHKMQRMASALMF